MSHTGFGGGNRKDSNHLQREILCENSTVVDSFNATANIAVTYAAVCRDHFSVLTAVETLNSTRIADYMLALDSLVMALVELDNAITAYP